MPLLAARCRLTPKKPYRSLHEQAHQLLDGERQNAKHQVAHDLVVAANPDELAAEVILEPSVGPLDGAPFVVADILGQPVTGALSPPRLVGQLPLAFGPARIDVDDRDVALA